MFFNQFSLDLSNKEKLSLKIRPGEGFEMMPVEEKEKINQVDSVNGRKVNSKRRMINNNFILFFF